MSNVELKIRYLIKSGENRINYKLSWETTNYNMSFILEPEPLEEEEIQVRRRLLSMRIPQVLLPVITRQ